ncbi:unnamed protein product [Ixodes persulcatus]
MNSKPGQWLAIVELLGEEATSSLPLSWLTEELTKCYWPTNVTSGRREFMIKSNSLPGPWRKFPIRVLGYASSYEEACEKVTRSLDTSTIDPESTVDANELDSDLEEPRTFITLSPPSLTPAVQSAPSLLAGAKSSGAYRPPFDVVSSATINTAARACTQAPELNRRDESALFKKILTLMVEVKTNVKSLEGRVQRLQQQLNGFCPETTLETQLPVFPLTSEKDVAAQEPKLGRREFQKEMVSYLERLGGETFKDAVVIMTKRLLSNKVMLLYTLKRTSTKKCFESLAFYGCMRDVLLKRFPSTDGTRIAQRNGKFLSGASDREGGREKRRKVMRATVENRPLRGTDTPTKGI